MADTDSGNRTYPTISANVWNELRLRFQKSVPAKVTSSYLQSALGFNTEKAAKNLLPQLRAVGLIDADGVPTDLAKTYRLDDAYAESTKSIVTSIYPSELRDLFPGPAEDATEVANWFMRSTGGGQATAGMQARFYLSLVSGDLPTAERTAKASSGDSTPPRPRRPRVSTPKPPTSAGTETEQSQAEPPREGGQKAARPNLHIDVQVHIAADASAEQIEAVFASMAKHLYGSE